MLVSVNPNAAIISAQTTPPAPVAVTGEPPEGKTLKNDVTK